jgi:hypothetical protein
VVTPSETDTQPTHLHLLYIEMEDNNNQQWNWAMAVPAQLLASSLICLQSQQQAKAWLGQTVQLSGAGERLQ